MNEKTVKQDYSLDEGAYLVKLARNSILHYLTFSKLLEEPKDAPESLQCV